jgi:hypothetical protein
VLDGSEDIMRQLVRIVLLVAVVAFLTAPVVAEPPPTLHNAGEIIEERDPVKLPGTVRRAGGEGGGSAVGGFTIDEGVSRRAQAGPMELGGSEFRVRGPLTNGGGSAVYGPRQEAEREIRRVVRVLD